MQVVDDLRTNSKLTDSNCVQPTQFTRTSSLVNKADLHIMMGTWENKVFLFNYFPKYVFHKLLAERRGKALSNPDTGCSQLLAFWLAFTHMKELRTGALVFLTTPIKYFFCPITSDGSGWKLLVSGHCIEKEKKGKKGKVNVSKR